MTDQPSYQITSGFYEAQGRRETMEDTHTLINDVSTLGDIKSPFTSTAFFGVYDGHGGDKAAKMVQDMLHTKILGSSTFGERDVAGAVAKGYEETDNIIVTTSNTENWMHGSTAVVAIVADSSLHISNIGDSEMIIALQDENGGMRYEDLTYPHKASDATEKKRIEDLGGLVFFNRVFGALAVSRSFGDSRFKIPKTSQNFVSWEPHQVVHTITPNLKFMVLACDGLWDVLSHNDAGEIVTNLKSQGKTPSEVAQALVTTALQKKTEDNVTVLVVYFNWSNDVEKTQSNNTENVANTNDNNVESIPEDPSTPVVEPVSEEPSTPQQNVE